MSDLMQQSYVYSTLGIYQHDLQENAHYGLLGLREWYFAREWGHKHRSEISVNINFYRVAIWKCVLFVETTNTCFRYVLRSTVRHDTLFERTRRVILSVVQIESLFAMAVMQQVLTVTLWFLGWCRSSRHSVSGNFLRPFLAPVVSAKLSHAPSSSAG